MKPRVYVETSVISYLAARPSSDAINATRQHFSYQLWERRNAWSLWMSEAVMAEAQVGNAEAVSRRTSYCAQLNVLDVHPDTINLVSRKAIPAKAFTDAVHIAIAALHRIDFIASWNFRHIAGAVARRNIELALSSASVFTPTIATPEELLENLP